MQIEAGKYYRTRDGRKVGPMSRCGLHTWPWGDGQNDGNWDDYCRDDGTTYTGTEYQEHPNDLVAEWTDGPVRTETVTKRRIVPGVYGRIRIWADSPAGKVRWSITGQSGVNCHDMTATELDDLAMVASQLAEALRDGMD